MKHNATHLPFRDWCVLRIAGKAPDWPHSRITHSSTAVPMRQLDYFFLNRRGGTDILTVRISCFVPLVPLSCSVVTKDQKTTLCKLLRHPLISWDSRRCVCEPVENLRRVLWRKQSRLLETTRHSWKRRTILEFFAGCCRTQQPKCKGRSRPRSMQTSPVVSRTTSSSGSADMRVGSARDFTCRLLESLLCQRPKGKPLRWKSWQNLESKSA